MPHPTSSAPVEIPRGDAAGFVRYLKQDAISGFLVFLIALPLCLGISLASGYPPLAGIFTAIIGAIVATALSNSELTIKGPAAGLIVIAVGCVAEFTALAQEAGAPAGDAAFAAYRMALAVGVAAAVLQVLFGLFRGGILSEFFPTSAVHGMLAAIGVIIILKQFPVALGVAAKGEPLELLQELPHLVTTANPAIAAIGGVSLSIMFLWPALHKKLGPLGTVPAPMVVLFVAIPMGMGFDLLHEHSYTLQGHEYQLSDQYLVSMPDKVFGMFEKVAFPDLSALGIPVAWKWVGMFFIIGTLESVLSAKAIDLIDPWKRKTSMDRDMVAVGVGNLASAFVGGLPMISEIVRSRANIDNGARTRFANLWHGLFLLVCVALFPTVLHRIPLAALAAMLVYTGYRLAHPTEFVHVYKIGREQLVIFVTTIVAVLATDLLIGIAIGIAVKMIIHVMNGVPLTALFKTYLEVEPRDERTCVVRARQSAVFSNWIPFRRQIEDLGLVQRQNIVLDLSNSKLVDHTVMEKLHRMQADFEQEGLTLEIVGLDTHLPVANHEHSARRLRLAQFQRLTVVADEGLEEMLEERFVSLGASGYTAFPCHGAGRHDLDASGVPARRPRMRIEVISRPDVSEQIVAYLREEVFPDHRVTACVETVEVIRPEHFAAGRSGMLDFQKTSH
ncbi:MAG: SulP family inorganic anion transporter [Planctomycetales bacterium]